VTEVKRVLFVGGLRPGGNGPDWMRAIEALGFSVTPFDTKSYASQGNRLEQAVALRTGLGRHISSLNRDVCDQADQTNYDVAFVTKGVQLRERTVQRLAARARSGEVLHLAIDSMFTDNRSRHFFGSIPHYTALFTDKRFEEGAYWTAGARRVFLFDQPYGLRFDATDKIHAARARVPESDVCFIGHCQPHYQTKLKSVADMGVDLKIWGPGWSSFAERETWARGLVMGEGLWGADYPAALSRARIGIGLLSKRIPEQATTRSVEIPAAGTLLLAERSARHAAMFREGVEAEFFSDEDEMRAKIARYLKDEPARARIAAAGAARTRRSYNMVDTVRSIFDTVNLSPDSPRTESA